MIKKEFEILGTIFKIELPNSSSNLFETLFLELKRIESKFSRFNSNSELMQLNSQLFTWQKIDSEFHFILKKSQEIKKITNGYFNISQKNNLEKIGYGNSKNISKLKFNNFISKNYFLKKNKVFLLKEIEIGGLGKGYAISNLINLLEKNNVKSYSLDGGGDIFIKGDEEIFLESPYDNNNVFAKVKIKNTTICSSSPSRRNFGKDKHHLINPKTNKSKSDILQVYIIEDNPILCDALSTALFVMGFDKAKKFSIKNKLNVFLVSINNEIYDSIKVKYLN